MNHAYTWWVRAIGNNGDLSPWGSGTAFSEGLLNTPALVSPAGASQNAAPTFTWNTVTGADYYDVYISDLTSGADPQSARSGQLVDSHGHPDAGRQLPVVGAGL